MRKILQSMMVLTSLAALSACGSSSGGGGGGGGAVGSGGAAGSLCNNASVNEGCFGATPGKRMQCVAGKWTEIATCAASEHCTESADPGAPGTTKHIATCAANGSVPDVTGGNDTSTGSDASTSDTGSGDTLVVDILGGEDTTIVKTDGGADTCTPKCAAKACGPNGCGGSCGTCDGNQTCDASGNCVKQSGGTVALGASCVGTTDACVAGAKCAAIADLSDWTCQKARNAGQSCGPGIGECATGAVCNFIDSTLKGMKCYATTSIGSACSTPGFGDCAADATCVYTDNQGSSTQCVSAVGPGGTCDVISVGLCTAGYGCVPASSGSGYQCLADVPAGSSCGAATGGCASGSDCVYDSSAKASATCQAAGQIGDACGSFGQPGSCVPWATCTPDSSTTGSANHCRAFGVAGGECGYNIGLCAPFLACSFTDASQTAMTCLKAGASGDTCGAGVGGCLPGYACFLAATGDVTGTCKDECATQNKYSDGTCDTCLKADPDCLK